MKQSGLLLGLNCGRSRGDGLLRGGHADTRLWTSTLSYTSSVGLPKLCYDLLDSHTHTHISGLRCPCGKRKDEE